MRYKIRKGKDLTIRWEVTTNGEATPLADRNLKLRIGTPAGRTIWPEFTTEGNTLQFTFSANQQTRLGDHTLTLIENMGQSGQTVVDCPDIIQFVATTQQEGIIPDCPIHPGAQHRPVLTPPGQPPHTEASPESQAAPSLTVTPQLDLATANLTVGNKGADGVGIQSIQQVATSTKPGGQNTLRITLTNGQSHDFTITNPVTVMAKATEWPANGIPTDNTTYHLGTIPSLRIAALPEHTEEGIIIYFTAAPEGFTLAWPPQSLWLGEYAPITEPGKQYVLTIADGILGLNEINQR